MSTTELDLYFRDIKDFFWNLTYSLHNIDRVAKLQLWNRLERMVDVHAPESARIFFETFPRGAYLTWRDVEWDQRYRSAEELSDDELFFTLTNTVTIFG